MIANARRCPPVPPPNLHGKEGVDGSSPSEGFVLLPAQARLPLSVLTAVWSSGVHRVAVDNVDHECRVGEDPDSIDPVTAGQLKTGNESFVLRFMMISSPSDPLRYLIYIPVLMILQHDSDCCRTRGLTLLSLYSAVGFEDVEPRLRRGILPRLHSWL